MTAPNDGGRSIAAAADGGVPIPVDDVQAYQACGWTLVGAGLTIAGENVLMRPPAALQEDAA